MGINNHTDITGLPVLAILINGGGSNAYKREK